MRKKFAFLVMAAASTCGWANAAVISSWGFDSITFGTTPANTGSTIPAPTAGSLGSDTGNGVVSGFHTAAASVWSTPAGNGTAKSLSVNTWGVNDYYEFTSDTSGQSGIMMLFDMTGSNTGPRDFKLQYSTTGTGGTYTDLPAGAFSLAAVTFSAGTPNFNTPPKFLFDLSSVAALNNNPSAAFRLVDTSTVSVNGGVVGTGGTNRVDNVVIGTNLSIPEPASLSLVGLLAGAVLRRRSR